MNATESALRERVKELRTLYRASRLLTSRDGSPLAERLQQFVDIIPAGWLYPDITEARLVLGDRTIATAGFRETPWLMSAAIDGPADAPCRLDVVVLEERPARDEGPFLREERELLDTLAAAIGDAVRHDRLAQLHAQTIASIDEAVIIVDARGKGRMIADLNPAAERMFGYDRAELVGRTTAMLHVDAAAFERFGVESRTALDDTGVFHAAYPLRRKDGTVFFAEQTVTLLQPDQGMAGGAVSIIRDVSERQRVEAGRRESDERMRQAQKLEAVGRLAGGIAHDFNNLMTVIRAQTELLLLDLPSGPLTQEIEVIQTATDKAAGLTAQLLAFSRDQVLQPHHVDIGAVMHGMASIIKGAVGESITVEYDLPEDMPAVELDPGQLELAVLNLAVNARDAMPAGGTLRVAVRADDAAALGDDVSPVTGACVVLEIHDSGEGMTEHVRSHVFEPFFTTKPPGKGTGLGLAMVYGFVKQSGGSISVDSTPGAGATFRLVFAAAGAEQQTSVAAPPPASTPALSDATVLLVEDDPNVRRVTTRILERDDFQVTAVADAEAGLELLHGGHSYDLILTDLGLPGMSGREFAQRVRHADAGAHVVLMSGYDVETPGRRVELPRDVTFLQKPFTRRELLAVIRAKLGAAAP